MILENESEPRLYVMSRVITDSLITFLLGYFTSSRAVTATASGSRVLDLICFTFLFFLKERNGPLSVLASGLSNICLLVDDSTIP